MEDNICGIYMIKNLINNKVYIGKSKNIKRRWCEHKADLRHNNHTNSYLQNSWNKYGEDCFEFSVIERCLCEGDLDDRERFNIRLYNSDDSRFGYNLTSGGENSVLTDEVRNNMKLSMRERYLREGKAVYCPELDCVFNCPIEAQEATGVNRQSISSCCRGVKNRKTAGTHPVTGERLHWFFANDVEKINNFLQGNVQRRSLSLCKSVICIELKKTFISMKDASDETGVCSTNISMCCSKVIQSAGKHPITGEKLHWVYADKMGNSSVA